MKIRASFVAVLFVLALTAAPSISWSQGRRPVPADVEALDLTEEQRKQIEELPAAQAAWRNESSAKFKELATQLQTAKRQGDRVLENELREERLELSRSRPSIAQILTQEQKLELEKKRLARRQERVKMKREREAGRQAIVAGWAGKVEPRIRAVRKQLAEAEASGNEEEVARLQARLAEMEAAVRKQAEQVRALKAQRTKESAALEGADQPDAASAP